MADQVGSDYYQNYYLDYDFQNPSHKLGFYLDLLRKHLPPGKSLFELGVGQGNFLKLASEFYSVQGCDVNAYGVQVTREKVPSAQVTEGSVEQIPMVNSFQAVASFDVLEHLPDLNGCLKTIRDRLPENGLLVGVVPVYDGPLGWLVHLLDKDPTHLTKVSRRKWLDSLESNGFEVIEWGGILRKLVGKTYLHFVAPQWLLRWVGTALYFVAQKK